MQPAIHKKRGGFFDTHKKFQQENTNSRANFQQQRVIFLPKPANLTEAKTRNTRSRNQQFHNQHKTQNYTPINQNPNRTHTHTNGN
jgi:hypothetical protein